MIVATILGSGTSNGVPMLSVDYPLKFLSNPRNHRTRPSLLLRGSKTTLLVDAGPDMRTQLLREGVHRLDAVLITHTHADHVMGMDDLRCFSEIQRMDMPVYARPEHQEDIRRIYPYAFQEFSPELVVPRFDLRPIEPVLEVGDLTIRTMVVIHGKAPVVAIRVNDFAYVTDVSEIPQEAWAQLLDLDTLVLDAVRTRPHPNHFHLEKAVEVAQALGAKKTYLTHLSGELGDHDELESRLPKSVRLAYDGLRIEV